VPGDTGVTAVTCLRAFYFCTQGCGRAERPAFPAPSDKKEGLMIFAIPGAFGPAGTWTHVIASVSEAIQYLPEDSLDCFVALLLAMTNLLFEMWNR
jgi:hypothetical protein